MQAVPVDKQAVASYLPLEGSMPNRVAVLLVRPRVTAKSVTKTRVIVFIIKVTKLNPSVESNISIHLNRSN